MPPRSLSERLSAVLPPLIFGCGVFNYRYNDNPYTLDTSALVASALSYGIRAFDTSPYYGPSESLLGSALSSAAPAAKIARSEYYILTKVGRVAEDEFDYSPAWVRRSVRRSLARLQTTYLDVVYCHDIEFVSEAETLAAVRELRRLRDEEGLVRHVGISGYPLDVLARTAELVLAKTGEPLDIVMSYSSFTLQNTSLAGPRGIDRLLAAGVDVVPNASPLGMGLLRRGGVPIGGLGDWHPAPSAMRAAVQRASDFCERHGERLEVIAIRYALESWLTAGAAAGSRGDPASGVPWTRESNAQVGGGRLGVSVMGWSKFAELERTMQVWRSILDGLEGGEERAVAAGRWNRDHEWSLNRKRAVQILAEGVQEVLDDWVGYEWESPPKGFVNKGPTDGPSTYRDDAGEKDVAEQKAKAAAVSDKLAPWPTPEGSPEPADLGDGADEVRTIPIR